MVCGTFLLTCHDAISKWMTATYHVGEVMLYRSAFPLVILIAVLCYQGGFAALKPRNPRANLTRGVLAALTSLLVVASYAVLPLADALAIIFASPIFLAALSVTFLGERVGARRWLGIFVGFVGVLIMVQPGADAMRLGALIAVSAALVSAIRDVVTRRLGTGDSTTNIILYTTGCTALLGLVSLLIQRSSLPGLNDIALFMVAGLLVTFAHWLIVRAFQLAEASLVGPLRYLAIVYAAVLGFLVFDEIPGAMQALGAVIVVLSGLYIVHRERVSSGERAAAAAAGKS